MALLHAQLSPQAVTAKAGRKSAPDGGGEGLAGEEGTVATLRLLTSVARFHRYAGMLSVYFTVGTVHTDICIYICRPWPTHECGEVLQVSRHVVRLFFRGGRIAYIDRPLVTRKRREVSQVSRHAVRLFYRGMLHIDPWQLTKCGEVSQVSRHAARLLYRSTTCPTITSRCLATICSQGMTKFHRYVGVPPHTTVYRASPTILQ